MKKELGTKEQNTKPLFKVSDPSLCDRPCRMHIFERLSNQGTASQNVSSRHCGRTGFIRFVCTGFERFARMLEGAAPPG